MAKFESYGEKFEFYVPLDIEETFNNIEDEVKSGTEVLMVFLNYKKPEEQGNSLSVAKDFIAIMCNMYPEIRFDTNFGDLVFEDVVDRYCCGEPYSDGSHNEAVLDETGFNVTIYGPDDSLECEGYISDYLYSEGKFYIYNWKGSGEETSDHIERYPQFGEKVSDGELSWEEVKEIGRRYQKVFLSPV